MPNSNFTDEELAGQKLANELTKKLKQIADERVDNALRQLASNNSAEDISKLCNSIEKAISSLNSGGTSPDLTALQGGKIQESLELTRSTSNSTNELLRELIEITRSPREVVYDDFGRVKEIRRKQG